MSSLLANGEWSNHPRTSSVPVISLLSLLFTDWPVCYKGGHDDEGGDRTPPDAARAARSDARATVEGGRIRLRRPRLPRRHARRDRPAGRPVEGCRLPPLLLQARA